MTRVLKSITPKETYKGLNTSSTWSELRGHHENAVNLGLTRTHKKSVDSKIEYLKSKQSR